MHSYWYRLRWSARYKGVVITGQYNLNHAQLVSYWYRLRWSTRYKGVVITGEYNLNHAQLLVQIKVER